MSMCSGSFKADVTSSFASWQSWDGRRDTQPVRASIFLSVNKWQLRIDMKLAQREGCESQLPAPHLHPQTTN